MTLLSPGIEVKEIDLSTTIARVSTGRGATVGKAQWGPAFQISQVTDETDFVRRFGAPNDYTAASFFTVSNFLKYGNDMRFVRVVDTTLAKNASPLYNTIRAIISSGGTDYVVGDIFDVKYGSAVLSRAVVSQIGAGGVVQALRVEAGGILDAISAGTVSSSLAGVTITPNLVTGSGFVATLSLSRTSGVYLPNDDELASAFTSTFLDLLEDAGLPSIVAKYPGEFGNGITVDIVNYADFISGIDIPIVPTGGVRSAKFIASQFEFGPQTEDQYAVVVSHSGVVAETFVVSTKHGDKDYSGANIYVGDVFGSGASRYITATDDFWPSNSMSLVFGGGVDNSVTAADYVNGWDLLSDKENIYVNLLMNGAAADEPLDVATVVSKYIVTDVAASRADCVAFISPPKELIVNRPMATAIDAIVAWRRGVDAEGQPVANNLNVNTSFGFIDGNYKFQYDKYNDKNRWVPLSGDIAGLCAYTDQVAQAWYSPGGLNRGQIKGVVKLALNPRIAQRDRLYEVQINPVISLAGEGYFLYGDKTSTSKPSAFSRINVRRLFNLLEKSISDAAKYRLFEINDEFTRNSFRTEISAYLENIRAQRGVYDFYVDCSERNNTAEVVDANEFRASILIKPVRSINYITLSFVATRTDANFEELLGSF